MSSSSTMVASKRPFSPLTWVLLWCSGAKRDVLRRCDTETSNYLGLGGAVLATATFATLSSTAALAMALHKPAAQVWPFGVAWGLAILNLDRWIVSTTVGHGAWNRFANFFVRMALAVVVSFVIAEPLLLTVFNPEIQAQIVKLQTQDRTQQNARLDAEYQPQLAAVDQKIATLRKQLIAEDNKVRSLYRTAICEARGRCGTGQVGQGWFFGEDWRLYTAEKARQKQMHQDVGGRIKNLEAERRSIQRQLDQGRLQSTSIIGNNDGILQRIKALSLLARDNHEVAIAAWFVRGIIIVLDVLPVLLKLVQSLDKSRPYERLLALDAGLDVDRAQRRWQQTIDDRVAADMVRNAERDTERDLRLKRDTQRRHQLGLDEPVHVWQTSRGAGVGQDSDHVTITDPGIGPSDHGSSGPDRDGSGGLSDFVSAIRDYEKVPVPLDPMLTLTARVGAFTLAGLIPYLLVGWATASPGGARPDFVRVGWPLLHWTLWLGGHRLLGLLLALLAAGTAALLALRTRGFRQAPRWGHLAAAAVAITGIASSLLPITAVTIVLLNATLSIFR